MKLFSKRSGAHAPSVKLAISDEFDASFYIDRYPDVAESKVVPLDHYLSHGWTEGRDPREGFSNDFYLDMYMGTNPDNKSPLEHYVEFGKSHDLKTAPSFDKEAPRPDLEIKSIGALLKELGLDTIGFEDQLFSKLLPRMFSAQYYRGHKELDDTVSDNECFLRYVCFDLSDGMSPGPMFDEIHYLNQLREKALSLPTKEGGAFRHWLEVGIKSRISPTPIFDEKQYLASNLDLKLFPGWLFEHFICHGLTEKRQFLDNFTFASQSLPMNETKPTSSVDEAFRGLVGRDGAAEELQRMQSFRTSNLFHELCAGAAELDPAVGYLGERTPSFVAYWHDADYLNYRTISRKFPKDKYSTIILMPFCKMGGADLVGSIVARLADDAENILIIRTDQSDWSQPNWFPENVDTVDLSSDLASVPEHVRLRVLYEQIRRLDAKSVYNVNSRAGFELFKEFGQRLALVTDLYAYFFCADISTDGLETGYPVKFFAETFSWLNAALVDTQYLANILSDRFALPDHLKKKIVVMHTPAQCSVTSKPVAELQVESHTTRERPKLIWAGRFDRQKRFDLFCEIALAMPEIDFECFGKAVLDAPPDLSALPDNINMNGPFVSYDDLRLSQSDGWLYTSAWDGLPTILIELGALGVPIVASGVGGVPELIDEKTGWLVKGDADVAGYVNAINDMLSSEIDRVDRASALQARVAQRHSDRAFKAAIHDLQEKF